MDVRVAEHAGACYGVQRALQIVEQAAEGYATVQTFGPLIHNPIVVSRLDERGVHVAESLDQIDAAAVVIRSHGVTPEEKDALDALEADVIDATCPHVLRAQQAAYDLAHEVGAVIVVGERDHPEVKGLASWAARGGGLVFVVSSADELAGNIPSLVGIVVQTTQSRAMLDDVVTTLTKRGIDTVVRDTICSATSSRQAAARALAEQVDCMVVVGGRNSANTAHLAQICSSVAPRTYCVQSIDEMNATDFAGVGSVGVTAGASTPHDQMAAIVETLRSW